MFAGFVGAVQLRLKIDEATSAKDDPTPIYLMDELCQMVGSNGEAIGTAVDHIVRRLNNKAPTVKQKALRLVRHVCSKGSPEFRRAVAKQSSLIRELTSFRCEPDPFKGDIPWKRVQQLAQEALASLHGAPEEQQSSSSGLGGRIQGFGSDTGTGGYSGGGGFSGGGGSSSRMVGFGSDSLGSGGGGGGASYGGAASRMMAFGSDTRAPAGYGSVGSGSGGGYGAGGGSSGAGSILGSISSGISSGVRSLATPARPQDSLLSEEAASGAGGYSAAASAPAPMASASALRSGGAAATPGSQEARVVDKVCTPAGLRAAPDREDLRSFVEAVSSLDGREVAKLLQERLERGPWQATLRALCAIEAVIESGSSASCGEVAVHYQANPEPIRRAVGSAQASVRQRADKVLRLIGGDTLPQEAAPQQAPLVGDLLGEPEPSASAPSEHVAAVGGLDLLGDMAAPPAAAAPPSANSVADLLGGLDVPQQPQPPPQQQQQQAVSSGRGGELPADLFSGMSMGGGGAATQPQPLAAEATLLSPPQAGTSVGGGGGMNDLLGGLMGPSAPMGGDLFSGLSVGGEGSGARPAAAVATNRQQPKQPQGSNNLEDLLSDLSISQGTQQVPMKPAGSGGMQQQGLAPQGLAPQGLAPQAATLGGMQGMGMAAPGMQAQAMLPGAAPHLGGGMLPGQFPQGGGMLGMIQAQAAMLQQLEMNPNPAAQQQALMMRMLMQQAAAAPQQAALMQQAMMQQAAVMGQAAGGGQAFLMPGTQPPQMPGLQPQMLGGGSGRGAIPLENFHDTTSHKPAAPSHHKDTFDFVGDLLKK